MSEEDTTNLFGFFVDRLTHQLERLEEGLKEVETQGKKGDEGSGLSMGWRFSVGGGSSTSKRHRPEPIDGSGPPSSWDGKEASQHREGQSREVEVKPRALAFFEVHEGEDELLVIADLPGLEEDAIEASLADEDLLVVTVDSDGYGDRREILLPAPLRDLKVTREGTITTIHCKLETL